MAKGQMAHPEGGSGTEAAGTLPRARRAWILLAVAFTPMFLFPVVMFVVAAGAVAGDAKNIVNLLLFLAAAWAVLGVLPLGMMYARACWADMSWPKRLLFGAAMSAAVLVGSEVLIVFAAMLGTLLRP